MDADDMYVFDEDRFQLVRIHIRSCKDQIKHIQALVNNHYAVWTFEVGYFE